TGQLRRSPRDENDARAFLRQRAAQRRPQALAAPGDQRRPSFDLHARPPLPGRLRALRHWVTKIANVLAELYPLGMSGPLAVGLGANIRQPPEARGVPQ